MAAQDSGGQHGVVEVVWLATGATRTWATARPGIPVGLSWADGRRLGFFWDTAGASPGSSGLWMLDTAAPGHDLLSGRRIMPAETGGDAIQYAQLTSAGTVIAAVTYDGTAHVGRGTVVGGIVELSARTGRPLRTLLAEHAAYSADPGHPGWYIGSCLLAAADRTGSHLLVSCDRFGRLDRAGSPRCPVRHRSRRSRPPGDRGAPARFRRGQSGGCAPRGTAAACPAARRASDRAR